MNKLHAVIDAGSSGTRLFLYEVAPGPYPLVEVIAEVENAHMANGEREEGINNFVNPDSPEQESQVFALTILPLLDKVGAVLAERGLAKSEVVVDLFATAGMRYTEKMFGANAVAAFYARIREGIRQAGFTPGEVRTSDGQQEEGVWTWVNLNDLERDIFRTDAAPLGIVEVGGSSAQLSYPRLNQLHDEASSVVVKINGKSFDVCCHTYLGLGQDDARKAMRIRMAKNAARCFPKGFLPESDIGDVLDGVGHYRLEQAGNYEFEACNAAYEALIADLLKDKVLPHLGDLEVDFVGTDAVYHATRYWKIEHDPVQLASMILAYCQDMNAFPGIELNEFVQAQAANATYIRALLFGDQGLFKYSPQSLLRALPNKNDGNTRLTWTRGYLLLKYSN